MVPKIYVGGRVDTENTQPDSEYTGDLLVLELTPDSLHRTRQLLDAMDELVQQGIKAMRRHGVPRPAEWERFEFAVPIKGFMAFTHEMNDAVVEALEANYYQEFTEVPELELLTEELTTYDGQVNFSRIQDGRWQVHIVFHDGGAWAGPDWTRELFDKWLGTMAWNEAHL